jgi:hypothetical protein
MYKLLPIEQGEISLCFRMEGTPGERHGSIGCLRVDFGAGGREFWSTWFDYQEHLKSWAFKNELDEIINSLRDGGPKPPFASRGNLESFCTATPGAKVPERGVGYKIRTLDYSYYFRCRPAAGDYDIYCFAYDNRYLLPELAGQHELPDFCFSTLPTTGEVILIMSERRGYFRCTFSTDDPAHNREIVKDRNTIKGITRAQEEAMLAGSSHGWHIPAAKPWNYDKDGKPRLPPPKEQEEIPYDFKKDEPYTRAS